MSNPSENLDPSVAARQVALEIMTRRDAGETITDQQVLSQHEHLREPLQEQLTRLAELREARSQASIRKTQIAPAEQSHEDDTHEVGAPVGDKHDDIRMTQIVDDSSFDMPDQGIKTTQLIHSETSDESVEKDAPTQYYRPIHRPPMASVKVYLDGSKDFSLIPLMATSSTIGRTAGEIRIEHDALISERHAKIERRRVGEQYRWYLVDLASASGTFVRIEHAILHQGDEFQIGKGSYQFIEMHGRPGISEVAGLSPEVWYLESNVHWIGRDIHSVLPSMREDVFLDPEHAIIRMRSDGKWVLINNDSLNGIWYRVNEVPLNQSCAFKLGEQLFGFQY